MGRFIKLEPREFDHVNDSQKSPFNMPELSWYYGYPFALGLMAVVAAALCLFYKKKNGFDEFNLSEKSDFENRTQILAGGTARQETLSQHSLKTLY